MKMRHELKHYINHLDYLTIKNRISHIASIDINAKENNQYQIRSIYFDDYNNRVLSEKIVGLNNRDKFRIRFYNFDSSFIKLEKKSKIKGLCKKTSSIITKEECESIFLGEIDFLRESDNHLFNELYVRIRSENLKPKTVVDYTREAYIYDVGNVRVTFDKSIKTGLSSTDVFNSVLPTIATPDPEIVILEVKYDEFLPELIADVIQLGDRNKTSVSKYAMCRIYG